MRIAIVFVLSLTIAGCDLFTAPKGGFRERAKAELIRREFLWDSLAIHDYDFDYVKGCECPSATGAFVHIEVRNDNVSRVLDDGGVEITSQPGMRWPTVDSLFARANVAVDNLEFTIQITFDTIYHYPVMIETFDQRNGELIRHQSAAMAPVTAVILVPAESRQPD